MSITDLGMLLLFIVSVVLLVIELRKRRISRQHTDEVIARVTARDRITVDAGELVFLQDRSYASKLFKQSPYNAVGFLCLTSDALEFHGEYVDGEPCVVSLPRQGLEVAWAGRFILHEQFWVRVSDGESLYFLTPDVGPRKAERVARQLLDKLARWAGRQEPVDLNKTVGAARVLAIATMLAIVLGVAGIVYAGGQLRHIHGPSHLAAGLNGNVYLVLDGKLYQLDSDGNVVVSAALDAMGLDIDVTDMVWHDGWIYLGQYATGQIHRCDPASFTCGDGLLAGGPDQLPYRTFKFTIGRQGETIYVADTARHRLAAYSMSGGLLYTSGDGPTVCFPNDLGWSNSGELLVADTNNHRVLALTPSGKSFRQVAWSLATVESKPTYSSCGNRSEEWGIDDPFASLAADYQTSADMVSLAVADDSQVWPSEVMEDRQGRLWVINSGNNMKHGVVLRFDSPQAEAFAVALPEDADPFSLAPISGGVLVTDTDKQRIWRVRDDLSYEAYGEGEIKAMLQRLASENDRWSFARAAAMTLAAVGGVMMLITLVVHYASRRRRLLSAT